MKFGQKTLKILKNFNIINPSLYFVEGKVISTLAPHKSIFARATIEETIPKNFAIYDMSKLLATISLLDDPEIECNDSWLNIKSGRTNIKYVYCNPKTIVYPPSDKKMVLPNTQIQFTLDQEIYIGCIKAMGVLSVPHLVIKGGNGILSIACTDVENPTSDVYSVDIGKTDKNFEIIFKAEYLNIIPNTYEIGVVVPTKKDSVGMSRWKSDDVEYFIAIEMQSYLK